SSPHSFDRFDISKIGSGQGAATYGHGLYFAEHEPVSLDYRRQFARQVMPSEEGLQQYFTPGSIVPGYGGYDRVLAYEPRPGGFSVRVHRVDPNGQPLPWERPREHSTMPSFADIQNVFSQRGLPPYDPARSYEVKINADPEELLHFDKR